MHRLIMAAIALSLTACATTSDAQPDPEQTRADPVNSEEPGPQDATVQLVLRVEARGGMCQSGACFSKRTLDSEGVVTIHSNTIHAEGAAGTPVSRPLTAAERARIDRALGAIEPGALEEGYGGCCNAHVDGSDTYVSFFGPDGVALREVRISSRPDTPPVLLELVASLNDLTP